MKLILPDILYEISRYLEPSDVQILRNVSKHFYITLQPKKLKKTYLIKYYLTPLKDWLLSFGLEFELDVKNNLLYDLLFKKETDNDLLALVASKMQDQSKQKTFSNLASNVYWLNLNHTYLVDKIKKLKIKFQVPKQIELMEEIDSDDEYDYITYIHYNYYLSKLREVMENGDENGSQE